MTRSFAVATLATLAASAAPAQTVRGLVTERASSDPVVADIALMDSAGTVVTTARSSDDGTFALGTRRTGVFMLRAVAIGYAEVVTDTFSLAQGEEVEVRILLSTQPVALPALEVTERRRQPFLEGFYQRVETGFGRYITREQIEQRGPLTLPDLMRTSAGIRVVPAGPPGWYAILGRRGCQALVVLDGMKITAPLDLVNTIPPNTIEGIEIYPGTATVPAEFATFDSGCGVVAIWTRRGTPDGRGSSLWKRIAAGVLVGLGALLVLEF